MVIYALAKSGTITLNGQSQGILSVLVIGAGTDYALLLISRYREHLHEYQSRVQAMVAAWKGAAPPILASAVTVILGLICLTLADLNSTRSLGPVCAIGIAATVTVMLTVLPTMLVLCGRWIFWPRIPRVDHQTDIATHGVWSRFAKSIAGNATRSWVSALLVLVLFCLAIIGLKTEGLSITDSFTNKPDAVTGQQIYDANFAQGAGAPAVILTNADKFDEVIAAASKVPGVDTSQGVCVQPDYAKLAAAFARGGPSAVPVSGGCVPAAFQVQPIGGKTLVNATLKYSYDTTQAYDTIRKLRSAVSHIDGADALVGGQSAVNLDVQDASRHDRALIIPIILLVILLVLAVVLRALIAPVILIATVVLSFIATLGVCALVFNHVFHFANADPSFPLFAFVFLVALGIDYNIFLMTRVREETLAVRHPRGDHPRVVGHRRGDHLGGDRAGCDVRGARRAADRVPRRDRIRRGVRRADGHDPGALDPGAGAQPRHRQEDLVAVQAGRRQGLTGFPLRLASRGGCLQRVAQRQPLRVLAPAATPRRHRASSFRAGPPTAGCGAR